MTSENLSRTAASGAGWFCNRCRAGQAALDLRGLRLGRRERKLLLSAALEGTEDEKAMPVVRELSGDAKEVVVLTDDESEEYQQVRMIGSRAAQTATRRAVGKLVDAYLLKAWRGEQRLYRPGDCARTEEGKLFRRSSYSAWYPRDVLRVVRTPLGEKVCAAFSKQLETGARIRWGEWPERWAEELRESVEAGVEAFRRGCIQHADWEGELARVRGMLGRSHKTEDQACLRAWAEAARQWAEAKKSTKKPMSAAKNLQQGRGL
jgi:hypothetical protein